jgi:hypothetical protein
VGLADGRVLAVKFDNTAKSHPQVGLAKADVVYVEQVEGGVTRLVAVYSSQLPKEVGPVRSARITDIELLRQYGTVALAYSGSQPRLNDNLQRARLKLVPGTSGQGYHRSSSRPAPYNVIGDPRALLQRAGGGVSAPKQVGYGFGPLPAGGKRARSVTARYPMATVGAVWSSERRRWLLSMDGRKDMAAEGGQLGAATFIIQYAKVVPSVFHDVNGVVTPQTITVGHGPALIFREGRVFSAKWSRSNSSKPTQYTIGGKKAVFAPGTIWVSLIARRQPVTVR